MEKLKALIPVHLVHTISRTNTEDLPLTCSSLLEFFLSSPHFHQIVGELTDREMGLCRKSAASALEWKRKGNHEFSTGDFVNALKCYTQALRFAPITADEMDKEFVATVFVNRATCMHKLGLLKECIRDCNRAVFLFPGYAKKESQHQFFQKTGKNNEMGLVHSRNSKADCLVVQCSNGKNLAPSARLCPPSKQQNTFERKTKWATPGTKERQAVVLCPLWKTAKRNCRVQEKLGRALALKTLASGRGKANASLGKYEDAIHDLSFALSNEGSSAGKSQIKVETEAISNNHWEEIGTSSIHSKDSENLGCFDKGRGLTSSDNLPPASLVHCEEPYAAAGGMQTWNSQFKDSVHENQSADLERRFMCISFESKLEHDATNSSLGYIPEHVHECGGVHWPAVLPPEVVLAGRVLAKSIEKQRHSEVPIKPMEEMDLCHNYVYLAPESKLELHVYSIVLAYCLQNSYSSEFPVSGTSVSQAHPPGSGADQKCSFYILMVHPEGIKLFIPGFQLEPIKLQIADLVLLISQVKVNSMAVTRMKSSETVGAPDLSGSGKLSDMNGSFTSNVEQNMETNFHKKFDHGKGVTSSGTIVNPFNNIGHVYQARQAKYIMKLEAQNMKTVPISVHADNNLEFQNRKRIRAVHELSLGSSLCPLRERGFDFQGKRGGPLACVSSHGGMNCSLETVGQWGLNERQRLLEDQYSFKCRCSGCLKLNLSDLVIHAFRCVKPDCLGVVLDCCSSKHENKEANFLYPSGSCSLEKLLSVAEKERESVNKMANLLLRTDGNPQIGPGYCLNCGSSCDLEQLHSAAKNSLRNIKRLQEMNRMKKISNRTLSDALRSLKLLRSTMHPYNKDVAQAEDTVAEALCLNGELEPAMHHCKASVEILEKLYPSSHIAIGNELMKLASIQLSINDHASLSTIVIKELIGRACYISLL
ncbi:hypothetical protein ACLOJK_024480 [Asimina triloba]